MIADGTNENRRNERKIPKKKRDEEKKGARRIRRRWKYRIEDEKASENLVKCSYTSRRTRLSCQNMVPRSSASKNNFCEVHKYFFRSLKEQWKSERRKCDPGIFIDADFDEMGAVHISDEDETLVNSVDLPCSEQDLYNDYLAYDDANDPLRSTEYVTEKEALVYTIETQKRKLQALKDFRELLAEKSKRKIEIYRKKMLEELFKGRLIAQSKKEKRLMKIHRANKSYHKLIRSRLLQNLQKKAKRRYEQDENIYKPFDYLNITQVEKKSCSYVFYKESQDGQIFSKGISSAKSDNDEDKNSKAIRKCVNIALPLTCYCKQHIFEDLGQQLFSSCAECGCAAFELSDGECYCSAHLSQKTQELYKKKSLIVNTGYYESSDYDLYRDRTCRSIFEDLMQKKYERSLSHSEQYPLSSPSIALSDETSRKVSSLNENESKAHPVNYVYIGEDDPIDDKSQIKPIGKKFLRAPPVSSPPLAAGIPSRSITFDKLERSNISNLSHSSFETSGSYFIKPVSMKGRRKDSESTCARAEPFDRELYESKKTRRIVNQRFIAFDQRNWAATGKTSSTILQKGQVTGQPPKVTTLVLQPPDNSRRASLSMNSNLTQYPVHSRPVLATNAYRNAAGLDRFADPNSISLMPATSGGSTQNYGRRMMGPTMRVRGSATKFFIRPCGPSAQNESLPRVILTSRNSFRGSTSNWVNRPSNPSRFAFNSNSPMEFTERTREEFQTRRVEPFSSIGGARSRVAPVEAFSSSYKSSNDSLRLSGSNRLSREVFRFQQPRRQVINFEDISQESLEAAAAVASISSTFGNSQGALDNECGNFKTSTPYRREKFGVGMNVDSKRVAFDMQHDVLPFAPNSEGIGQTDISSNEPPEHIASGSTTESSDVKYHEMGFEEEADD